MSYDTDIGSHSQSYSNLCVLNPCFSNVLIGIILYIHVYKSLVPRPATRSNRPQNPQTDTRH